MTEIAKKQSVFDNLADLAIAPHDGGTAVQEVVAGAPLRLRRLSINTRLVNKNEGGDPRAFAEGFENRELTIEQLAAEIGKGHAFAAQFKGRRRAENFIAADVLTVDIVGIPFSDESSATPKNRGKK